MVATDNAQRIGRTSTPIDRTRIGGSRSKSGCQTCRSRRVKCDETRPVCIRCSKLGLHCDTKPIQEHTRKKQTDKVIIYVAPVTDPSGLRLDDPSRLAFEYFISKGARDLGNSCSSELWTVLIPRLAIENSAVKHAAVALSIFHRSFSTQQESAELDKTLALKHYGKSLASLQDASENGRSSESSLVCCTMFYVIEALQAHFSSAASILTSGIRLLTENTHSDQDPDKEHFRQLRRALTLLGTAAMAIEETGYERCIWLATEECLRKPISNLSALEAIRDELSLLMNDVICLDVRATFTIQDSEEQSKLVDEGIAIRERYKSFLRSIASLSRTADLPQHDRATLLLQYATRVMFKITLECVTATTQSVFDEFLPQFNLIVQICEKFLRLQTQQRNIRSNIDEDTLPPTFTMCLGIVPCLYFVSSRCRESKTRHKAFSLLKRCNRREGVWDSNLVSNVAEAWIKHEESTARKYWKEMLGCHTSDDLVIPEKLRIHFMLSKFSSEKNAQIQFVLTTGEVVTAHALKW